MDQSRLKLVEELARKSIEISKGSVKEIDRYSWMVLHEYIHGVMPSEYDIREVDEELYIAILNRAKQLQ